MAKFEVKHNFEYQGNPIISADAGDVVELTAEVAAAINAAGEKANPEKGPYLAEIAKATNAKAEK